MPLPSDKMKVCMVLLVLSLSAFATAQTAPELSSEPTVAAEQTNDIQAVAKDGPYDPMVWLPKTSPEMYKPATVDWAGLIASCRAAGNAEHRLRNYLLRTVFHDALSVDTSQCTPSTRQSNNETADASGSGNVTVKSGDGTVKAEQTGCVGALDGSIYTDEELARLENVDFAKLTSKVILRIAAFHDASIADTLAICGAISAEDASHGLIKFIGHPDIKFSVGRLDRMKPSPKNQLFSPEGTVPEFVDFWGKHGFSPEEGVALLGTHSLLRQLGCSKSARPDDDCRPAPDECKDVRIFKFTTNYYHDVCTPTVTILPKEQRQPPMPYSQMPQEQWDKEAIENVCSFSSEPFRNKIWLDLVASRKGAKETFTRFGKNVEWNSDNCQDAQQWGVDIAEHCPHRDLWPYTINDAHLGRTCQGIHGGSEGKRSVQEAMHKYISSPSDWANTFQQAYMKMINQNAMFDNAEPMDAGFIKGDECPNKKKDDKCASFDAVNGISLAA